MAPERYLRDGPQKRDNDGSFQNHSA